MSTFLGPCFCQRRRDDDKNKNSVFCLEGGDWGQRGKSSKSAVFVGERHDDQSLKVQILLSKVFVVIVQAPILPSEVRPCEATCSQTNLEDPKHKDYTRETRSQQIYHVGEIRFRNI